MCTHTRGHIPCPWLSLHVDCIIVFIQWWLRQTKWGLCRYSLAKLCHPWASQVSGEFGQDGLGPFVLGYSHPFLDPLLLQTPPLSCPLQSFFPSFYFCRVFNPVSSVEILMNLVLIPACPSSFPFLSGLLYFMFVCGCCMSICIHECENQRLMSSAFFYCSPPYFLRHSLNLEFTEWLNNLYQSPWTLSPALGL